MPQDIFSGREGNENGRKIAKVIAAQLNMTLRKGSNEGNYQGKLTVIKSAKHGNTQFGITDIMLSKIEQVILAKQVHDNGPFSLYLIPVEKIRQFGTETRSKGASAGKVTNFNISKTIVFGMHIGSIDVGGCN